MAQLIGSDSARSAATALAKAKIEVDADLQPWRTIDLGAAAQKISVMSGLINSFLDSVRPETAK